MAATLSDEVYQRVAGRACCLSIASGLTGLAAPRGRPAMGIIEQTDCRRSTFSLSRADERAIDVVIDLLRPARRLLFITGAGLSADSGLPTYRGRDGVYRAGLTTPHGLTIEQALSGPMLAARPEITWHHLFELERAARGGVPNRGHRVIAEME